MSANEQASSESSVDQARPTKKLTVNVADLRRRLGEQRVVSVNLVLPTAVVVQSRTTPDPVVGEVLIESIERGVSVTGSVTYGWEADCRRCLAIVKRSEEIEIDEIFQVEAPNDSEMLDFDGKQIDLFPAIRDAVGLSLPLAPLCDGDCLGPDPQRYPAEVEGRRSPEPRGADPRWAALDQLQLDDT